MNNNITTNGDGSPIINGSDNTIKTKKTTKQNVVWGIGGFVIGVLASLVANWIWHFFC